MRKVHSMAVIDPTKCIGDRICENVCPTGAIQMVDKKAVVDEHYLPLWLRQRGIDPQEV